MKKTLFFILLALASIVPSFGQGGYYYCNFEDSVENAQWNRSYWTLIQANNNTRLGTRGWIRGSNHQNWTTSRTLSLNAGATTISFDWYPGINSCCNYELNVYLGSILVANTNDLWSQYQYPYNIRFTTTITVPTAGSYSLRFVWSNSCSTSSCDIDNYVTYVWIDNVSVSNTESFQSNFENNNTSQWSFVNDGSLNNWYIGSSTSCSGTNSLYVSNDRGLSSSYVNSLSSFAYTYRNIILGASNCHISYDWKSNGEPNGDYMRAFLVPFSQSLDSIGLNLSSVTLPSTAIPLDGNQPLCGSSSWNHYSSTFTITTVPTTYKLVFLWVNNGNGIGNNPPAAIDNVAVNSRKHLAVTLTDPYHSTASVSSNDFDYMETANVVITPTPHYHVTSLHNYNGPIQYVSPSNDTCQIIMDNNYNLHVDVAIDTHTVQVDTRLGYGSASVTNNGQIPYGQVCTVTADTSNPSYRFYTWSNGVTANPYTFVVTQDTSLTAIYIVPGESHLLQVTSANETMGQATITGDCIYQDLYQQGNVVLTATANYGYHFVQWSDGITANPRTLYLSNDTNLTAIFAINQYTLSLQTNDAALGTATGGGSYDYLSQATMTAVPSSHCHFVQWHDGNTTNPRLITLTQNMSFMANFAQDPQYTINVMVNDPSRGSADGGGIFYAGDYATLSAYPNEHYYFSSWSDGVNANPYYLTVIENASYTAMFEPINYNVNLTCNDDYMGSVCGGGSYPYGSTANIEAQPFDGFRFIEWSDGNTNASRSLLVEGNISLQASFGDAHTEGIDDVIDRPIMTVIGRQIVVSGAAGQNIMVYDVIGRKVTAADKATDRQELTVPASGVYIVRIDGYKSLKCVVR